jgi:rhodanese-related sulfurtransferase
MAHRRPRRSRHDAGAGRRARADGAGHLRHRRGYIDAHELAERFETLDPAAPTVLICHHGMRSAQVGYFLEQHGFSDIVNLNGGVARWAEQVDPAMPRY